MKSYQVDLKFLVGHCICGGWRCWDAAAETTMTSPRAGCAFPTRSLLVGQASTESRLSEGGIVSRVVERGLYRFGAAGTRLLRSENALCGFRAICTRSNASALQEIGRMCGQPAYAM